MRTLLFGVIASIFLLILGSILDGVARDFVLDLSAGIYGAIIMYLLLDHRYSSHEDFLKTYARVNRLIERTVHLTYEVKERLANVGGLQDRLFKTMKRSADVLGEDISSNEFTAHLLHGINENLVQIRMAATEHQEILKEIGRTYIELGFSRGAETTDVQVKSLNRLLQDVDVMEQKYSTLSSQTGMNNY